MPLKPPSRVDRHPLTRHETLSLQEESAKEKEYQKVIGPRPPSIVQTDLSRELSKYQEAHARTTESNQVLHKAMTLHIAYLRLLALPLDELEAKIPSVDNIGEYETISDRAQISLPGPAKGLVMLAVRVRFPHLFCTL